VIFSQFQSLASPAARLYLLEILIAISEALHLLVPFICDWDSIQTSENKARAKSVLMCVGTEQTESKLAGAHTCLVTDCFCLQLPAKGLVRSGIICNTPLWFYDVRF
jgi:hypothetical protein